MSENAVRVEEVSHPGRTRMLEWIEEQRRQLDELEGLVAGGALEPNPTNMLHRRTLNVKQAAEILEIHPNSLHRVAQAGLIPHDRSQGWGGGRGGQYRFSPQELAEVKPRIRELVSKSRRLLSVGEEEYVTISEAMEATGLSVRVIENMLGSGKVHFVKETGGDVPVEKIRLKDLFDAIIQANIDQNQNQGSV